MSARFGSRGKLTVWPDFVIVGAQKSGSTSLMAALANHPQVYLPKGETRYFRDAWYSRSALITLADEVRPRTRDAQRYGIKCPDYLTQETAAVRIRNDLGAVQVIAVLRDPVARAISALFWGMQWGYVPVCDPEAALIQLMSHGSIPGYPRSVEVLRYGMYGDALQRYYALFGREQVLVLLTDNLSRQPREVATRTFEFLGVDPALAAHKMAPHENAGVYSLTRLRFLARRHRYILSSESDSGVRYIAQPTTWRAKIADRAIAATDRVVLRRLLSNAKPRLSDGVMSDMKSYYADDTAKVRQLLGPQFTGWA